MSMEQLVEVVERLGIAVAALDKVAERLSVAACGDESVAKITATAISAREEELERKLAEAEAKVTALQAESAGRKTLGVGRMFAKEGAASEGALDVALQSLTVEQRLAVKAELMRTGLA